MIGTFLFTWEVVSMKHRLIKWISGITLGAVLALGVSAGVNDAHAFKAEDSNSVTFSNFADKGESSGGSCKAFSYVNNDVTVSTDGGYATKGVLRVYSGKKLTISSKNYKIGSIDFTYDSDNKEMKLGDSVTGVNDVTWSYTMTAQARFSAITVKFALSDATVTSIAADQSTIPSSIASGSAISYDGIKINATCSDESVYNVAAKCDFSPAAGTVLSEVGPQVVTVTYKASNSPTTTSGSDLTTSFTLSVTQGERPTNYEKASSIKAGDQILFVNEGAGKAAKGTLTPNDVAYKHYLDTDDDTILFLLEEWEDQASLELHFKSSVFL